MTTTIRRRAAACLLVLCCASFAGALDLASGRVRLTLHDGIGRFSLSYLSNSRESTSTPLLVAQDPRTTVLSIVVGNKVTRLGEGSEFSLRTEKTADGGRFVWKSSLLTVTQSFSFLTSEGAAAPSGVRVDVEVKNTSRQDLAVGLRYLFDTYLGEASFKHFRTNALPDVSRELTLSGDAMPQYWVSALAEDPEELGLQVMTSGEGITVPDKVVFANWKRLSDASWTYPTSTARNFNLLPYSVNDSAVCQYYEPRKVARGSATTVTLLLGKYTPAGFTLKKPVETVQVAAAIPAVEPAVEQPPVVEPAVEQPPLVEQPPVVEPAVEQPPVVEPVVEQPVVEQPPVEQPPIVLPPEETPAEKAAKARQAAQMDIASVNAVIGEIDSALAGGRVLSEADLARLRAAIEELRARREAALPESLPPGTSPAEADSSASGE